MSLLDYNEENPATIKDIVKSAILSYYQQFASKKINIVYANIDGKDFDELTEENWDGILKKADEYNVFIRYKSHSWDLCIAIYSAHFNWPSERHWWKAGMHTLAEFLSQNFNQS